MSFLYFAYGSNMLISRLTARCPSARAIGKATASGYTLAFIKPSKDNSGKATLVARNSMYTPGVLFEIDASDRRLLDQAEGAGNGYDRDNEFQVVLVGENKPTSVFSYLATNTEAHLRPYDWYLALVIAGARQHELDVEHIQRLYKTEYIIDTDLVRKGRIDALTALSAYGSADGLPPSVVHALERPC